LAETSRTPFDLQEAESELVAGFFTEHGATIFVFFFLAEYSSIVLFSCISAIFFLGGYNLPAFFFNDSVLNLQSIILGVKTSVFCFLFVLFRATLPRLRYDQLINLCWLYLLPIAVAFIIIVPSILVSFDFLPYIATSSSYFCLTLVDSNKKKYLTPFYTFALYYGLPVNYFLTSLVPNNYIQKRLFSVKVSSTKIKKM
jgi:hypothetical protein